MVIDRTAVAQATLAPERLGQFAVHALQQVSVPEDEARLIADALVWADLRGIGAQGIAKLPLIVARIRAGGTPSTSHIVTVHATSGLAVLDANHAWGHVAGVVAMRRAIELAESSGLGAVVVRNTSSASAMGYYAMMAVTEGMVGIAINNTTPLQPPWGGTSKVLGNQAFAIGAPNGTGPPVLFDTATTAITWTGIEKLRETGEPVPEGVALDQRGEPTTDHDEALAGVLLPMGGHRGFGLALMWEILTGVLAGGERYGPTITPLSDLDRPQSVSHFMLALDPRGVPPASAFAERVATLVDRVHQATPAAETERVRVPGERAAAVAAARQLDGVPLSATTIEQLNALADDFGMDRLT